jgi:hypothetical protein
MPSICEMATSRSSGSYFLVVHLEAISDRVPRVTVGKGERHWPRTSIWSTDARSGVCYQESAERARSQGQSDTFRSWLLVLR